MKVDETTIHKNPNIGNTAKQVFVTEKLLENPNPFLFAHSMVVEGQGTAMVLAVGKHTFYA